MVVNIHAFNLKNITVSQDSIYFFELFFSEGVSRIAVPFFFIISGYLFFYNFNGTKSEYISKGKKRIKTIVAPYFFWSIFSFFFYFILESNSITGDFFSKYQFENYSIRNYISTIVLYPIAYQLWFLKDLLLLLVFTPLIFILIKKFDYYVLLPLFTIWIFEYNLIIVSPESLLFFYFGSYLSIKQKNILFNGSILKTILMNMMWLLLIGLKTTLVVTEITADKSAFGLHKTSILVGILAFWTLFDISSKKVKNTSSKIYTLSFFIYVMHEPLLTIMNRVCSYYLSTNPLTLYLVSPSITILCCIFIGLFLKKRAIKFYYLITGGR